jgi:hypothetical protein
MLDQSSIDRQHKHPWIHFNQGVIQSPMKLTNRYSLKNHFSQGVCNLNEPSNI